MKNLLHFFQYHNAVPIALGILVLGGGAAFAATNPQAIYNQTQTPVSVDNTYIAGKDLSIYMPRMLITSVTEDAEQYYVGYDFLTIDVENYVWRDVTKHLTLTVPKGVLGNMPLAGYVTEQLKQNLDHEADRLKESQTIAKRNVSQKMVATAYGGIVGAFLDDTTETLPGYTPPAEPVVLPAPDGNVAVTPLAPVPQNDTGLTREEVEQLITQRVNELLAGQQASPPVSPPPSEIPPTEPPPPPAETPTPANEPASEPTPPSSPTEIPSTPDS